MALKAQDPDKRIADMLKKMPEEHEAAAKWLNDFLGDKLPGELPLDHDYWVALNAFRGRFGK